jgi:hypothetical protein
MKQHITIEQLKDINIELSILLFKSCYEGTEMDKSLVNMSGAIFIDDNIKKLISSNSLVKICFTYDNKLDKSWNSGWRGKCVCDWDDITPNSIKKILYQDGYGREKYE